MLDDALPIQTRPGCHRILLSRLLALAEDTDRAGLHREAALLNGLAASLRGTPPLHDRPYA